MTRMRMALVRSIIALMIVLTRRSSIDAREAARGAFIPQLPLTPQRQRLNSALIKSPMSYLDSINSSGDTDGVESTKKTSPSYLDSLLGKESEEAKEQITDDKKDDDKKDDDKSDDNPTALEVLQTILAALSENDLPNINDGLTVTFNHSTDNCRAALGGSLENFIIYANNPTFGFMIDCDEWEVENVGPIIAGSPTRGEMQTILVKITACDSSRNFLFTMQKQRRPPRQNQWLVHECLFVDMAFELTE